jgi:hypothetical protein
MSDRGKRPLSDDLLPLADRLRRERPSIDALALDRKARARTRAAAAERRAVPHGKELS